MITARPCLVSRSIVAVALALSIVTAALFAAVPLSAAPQKPTLRQEANAFVVTGAQGIVVLARAPGKLTCIAAGIDLATPRRPMLAGDRFRIGSITKTFVAALVLRLAEDRRLSLDDSVEQWLPGFVPNGDAISVRQPLEATRRARRPTNAVDMRISWT